MSRGRFKADIFMAAVTLAVTALAVTAFLHPGFRRERRGSYSSSLQEEPVLKVTYLYVGQGDATLIRSLGENGKTMLVDAGPSAEVEEYVSAGRYKGRNHAAEVIIPYLKKEGIEKIDYLVATHKHGDHIGGIPYILENFPVGAVYDNGTEYPGTLVEEYLEAVEASPDTDFIIARPGMEMDFGSGILCQVIAPLREYSGTESDENNMSLVLRIGAGEVSFLLPGDIETPAELDILAYGEALRTTVVKAPHHGSASSSSRPFLDLLLPEAVVFSCGRYNPYGLPPFEIIRRYEDLGSRVYRTDTDGNIEFYTDGISYTVNTER